MPGASNSPGVSPAARPRGRRITHWWRGTARPAWNRARPLVVIAAGLTVLVLGTIGYLRLPDKQYGILDALYRALGLFALGGAVDPPVPRELEVARILAPLLTGYAAVRGLLALAREQLELLWIRLLTRDHVVVAGLGDMGYRLATAFYDADHHVVAIEVAANAPSIARAREHGIRVVVGDATDPALLGRTRVDRARYLIGTCGEDGMNVRAVDAAAELVAGRRRGVLTAFAHLDELELWRAVSAEALAVSERAPIRLEFFNTFANGARLLLERHPPFAATRDAASAPPHVLVVGLDEIGEQVVLHIARIWQRSVREARERMRLTVVGPHTDGQVHRLVSHHPALDTAYELRAREMDLRAAAFRDGEAMLDQDGKCDVTAAYVCLARDSEGLAAAVALHAAPQARKVPVVVVISEAERAVGTALSGATDRLAGIELFGVLSEALSPTLLVGGTNELLARAKHEEYLATERAKGITAAENPSAVPWEELPESLQESNRRFADGIGRKLRAAGCVVVPAPLMDHSVPLFAFADQEVEELARQEHERWAEDLRRDGWSPTDGPKDPQRRLHPLLVPWEELPEDEREKDRAPVRELPAMLARVGLRIERAASPSASPRAAA